MVRRRQRLVGITIDPGLPFGQQIMAGVYRYSQEHEPWRFHVVEAMPYLPASEIPQWRGDGIIGMAAEGWIKPCLRRGIPFVNIATHRDPRWPSVIVDNREVGAMAAGHLLAKGLREFAIVYRNDLDRWAERIAGFVGAIRRAGCQVQEVPVGPADPRNPAGGCDIMQAGPKRLRQLSRPTGLFATHDGLGREVIDCCLETGLRVPEDIAVIGEGNRSFVCELMLPRMTSVEPGSERVGYRAAELLDRLMQGGQPPAEPILVPPVRVIERESTDVRAIGAPLVAEAIQFIRDHLDQPIQTSDILQELPVNRRTLERQFRRALGRTVFEEIRSAKMRHACDLLIATDMTVGQICQACGYPGRERFNAAFKTETGMTPTEFRRRRTR